MSTKRINPDHKHNCIVWNCYPTLQPAGYFWIFCKNCDKFIRVLKSDFDIRKARSFKTCEEHNK